MPKRQRTPPPMRRCIMRQLGPDVLRMMASFLSAKELDHFSTVSHFAQAALLADSAWPSWKRAVTHCAEAWARSLQYLDLTKSPHRARNRIRLMTRPECQLCATKRGHRRIHWPFRLRLCSPWFMQNTVGQERLWLEYGLGGWIPETEPRETAHDGELRFWKKGIEKLMDRPLQQMALDRERVKRQISHLPFEHAFAPWQSPDARRTSASSWLENGRARCPQCKRRWCEGDEHQKAITQPRVGRRNLA